MSVRKPLPKLCQLLLSLDFIGMDFKPTVALKLMALE